MGAFFNNVANLGRKANKLDPLDRTVENFALGKPTAGRNYYGEGPIAPPGPPTQDTAANAAEQQADSLRRRRGIMANVFGGANGGGSPQVASKTALGS